MIITMMGGMWLLMHQAHNKKPFLDEDDDAGSDNEAENANVPESDGQDTGVYYGSSSEHNFQPQDELETIPEEEEPQTEEKQDIADTVVFKPDECEEEPFNMQLTILQMTQQLLWANPLPTHLSPMMYAFQLRR